MSKCVIDARRPVASPWISLDHRQLKVPQHSVTRAKRAWILGSTAEALANLKAREMTGKELRALREALKLSQEELAEILGVQRVTVARAETGKYSKHQEPNPDRTISRLLRSLLDLALRAGKLKMPTEEEEPELPPPPRRSRGIRP